MSINQKLLDFLAASPTAFHAVRQMQTALEADGFTELQEHRPWNLTPGKAYYVIRGGSALIAFRIPEQGGSAFQIVASHSDSPGFKLKNDPEMTVENAYVRLNTEGYGGMLCAPWFDRPLSVAGRVIVETDSGIASRLVTIERDLLMIPSLAIHMNRQANSGYAYNIQKDLLPLMAMADSGKKLQQLVAEATGVPEEAILAQDLFLYNRQPGCIWGADNAFIASPRIDDLQCGFAALTALLQAKTTESIAVHCVFDNEEVGSTTRQGAASTFLKDTLKRVVYGLGGTEATYLQMLAASFMISADNAHALHPNYPDKTDPANRPVLNGGIVIKHNANQKYTTDAVSEGIFTQLCRREKVPVQHFVNRSDMAGGSTLGSIANTQTPMHTVDIGLPQLAMHSPYETAGAADTASLIKVLTAFYRTAIRF